MGTFTDLNNGSLQNFIQKWEERMKKAKVIVSTSLFEVEPNWKMLDQKRCPICGSLLKLPQNGKIAYCKGLRHGDKRKFIIRRAILEGSLKIK